QVTDIEALTKIIDDIINNNPDNVAKYKEGKTKLFGFFVGEAMKVTKGKANPQTINDLLKSRLN
ncbi:MAG: Asp-tRNA(Asn)/Glu-tRNA(Gln) amidotransferase GatCAB subunit B, partial [Anaplasmataceae bacterium]|nr:Asp-tRNA(Asn)/Glu-tRNA(Gln) amidotransferase GatCAB subunit B [Anaplasmataceae bacterium]